MMKILKLLNTILISVVITISVYLSVFDIMSKCLLAIMEHTIEQYDNLGFVPDCIIVLSDMQVDHLSGYDKQKLRQIEKNTPLKLAFNLQAYESTPLTNKNGWIQFAGWSDRLFQYLDLKTDSGIAQRLWDNPIYQF